MFGPIKSKSYRLGGSGPGFFDRALTAPNGPRLLDMEMPCLELVVKAELDRDARLRCHGPILQELLQLLQAQSEVRRNLA